MDVKVKKIGYPNNEIGQNNGRGNGITRIHRNTKCSTEFQKTMSKWILQHPPPWSFSPKAHPHSFQLRNNQSDVPGPQIPTARDHTGSALIGISQGNMLLVNSRVDREFSTSCKILLVFFATTNCVAQLLMLNSMDDIAQIRTSTTCILRYLETTLPPPTMSIHMARFSQGWYLSLPEQQSLCEHSWQFSPRRKEMEQINKTAWEGRRWSKLTELLGVKDGGGCGSSSVSCMLWGQPWKASGRGT